MKLSSMVRALGKILDTGSRDLGSRESIQQILLIFFVAVARFNLLTCHDQ